MTDQNKDNEINVTSTESDHALDLETNDDDFGTHGVFDDSDNNKKPFYKNKKFILYGIGGLLVFLVLFSIGGGFSVSEPSRPESDLTGGKISVSSSAGDNIKSSPLDATTNNDVDHLYEEAEKQRLIEQQKKQEEEKQVVAFSSDFESKPIPIPPELLESQERQAKRDEAFKQKYTAPPPVVETAPPQPAVATGPALDQRKYAAAQAFLAQYMTYPTPSYSVSKTRQFEIDAQNQQRIEQQKLAMMQAQAEQQNQQSEQPQGQLLAQTGDMAFAIGTLGADTRRGSPSPMRAVIKGGKLNGAVLMGRVIPVGQTGNDLAIQFDTLSIKGRPSVQIQAFAINPKDYDVGGVADIRKNHTFLQAVMAWATSFVSNYGHAKLDNVQQESIVNENALVTNRGTQTDKELLIGAAAQGIDGARGVVNQYIAQNWQSYAKILPGKEFGVLFMSDVVVK